MDKITITPDYNKIKELTRNYTALGGGILAASTATPIYSYFSTGKLTETMTIGPLILGGIGCALLAKGLSTYFNYKNSFLELKPKEKEFKGRSIDDLTKKEGNYQTLMIQNPYTRKNHGTIEVKLKNNNNYSPNPYETFTIPLVKNPTKIIEKTKSYLIMD